MILDFNSVLLIIIIFQFLLVGIFLITHTKGRRLSNLLLGLFCLGISLNIVDMLLLMQGQYDLVGFLSMLDLALILVFGPLIYLYAKSVLYRDFRFEKKLLLHFIPFFIIIILVIVNALITPMEYQVEAIKQMSEYKLSISQALVVVPFYIHMLIYWVLFVKEIRSYNRVISEEYSDLEPYNINWLKFLFRSFLAIILVSMALSLLPYSPLKKFTGLVLLAFVILVFFIINTIIFKAMKQPGIFSGISIDQKKKKYVGSKLSEKEKLKLLEIIINNIDENKPFLDPGLSLSQLAEMTGLKSREVSQVINEKLEMSFHDYINTQRIEHAKKLMLSNDQKTTILEILYQSGFNSKSSFNTAFKKATNQTPTEYRKLLKLQ